jgi:hypothetical protein
MNLPDFHLNLQRFGSYIAGRPLVLVSGDNPQLSIIIHDS